MKFIQLYEHFIIPLSAAIIMYNMIIFDLVNPLSSIPSEPKAQAPVQRRTNWKATDDVDLSQKEA